MSPVRLVGPRWWAASLGAPNCLMSGLALLLARAAACLPIPETETEHANRQRADRAQRLGATAAARGPALPTVGGICPLVAVACREVKRGSAPLRFEVTGLTETFERAASPLYSW
jgi:hypothetical protein